MNALIIHGFLSHPDDCWFPWLKRELERHGWQVNAPPMPNSVVPRRAKWLGAISENIEEPKKTVLIGHSLGAFALIRFLETYEGPSFPALILAAGFGRRFPNRRLLTHDWSEPEINFKHVRSKVRKIVCIHSDDDRTVPYEEGEWLCKQLKGRLITEHKGHFMKFREKVVELPSVLDAALAFEPRPRLARLLLLKKRIV